MIRPAVEADLAALVELGRRSWLSAFAQTAPFELIAWWARTDRTRTLYAETWREMVVLEEAGGIAGLLHVRGAEINGLFVHPASQGRGVGTLLLKEGEGRIAEAGHPAAWLTCSAFNTRAMEFYRWRGYVETGRERYQQESGVEVEDVRMERRLDHAASGARTMRA